MANDHLYLGSIITKLESFGLPVKMLRYVEEHYRIRETDRKLSATDQEHNVLMINKDKYKHLLSMTLHVVGREPASHLKVENAVKELYHEATHAFIDYHQDQAKANRSGRSGPRAQDEHGSWIVLGDSAVATAKKVEEVMMQAARHYRKVQVKHPQSGAAILAEGRGEEVAHEAAAVYVSYRVKHFWMTVVNLTDQELSLRKTLKEGLIRAESLDDVTDGKAIAARERNALKNALSAFDERMTETVHGYLPQCDGPWGLKLGDLQCAVSRPGIPLLLKAMCHQIMEGKVPDFALSSPTISRLARGVEAACQQLEAEKWGADQEPTVPSTWQDLGKPQR